MIATGLNSDTKREYNSIPHTTKSDFTLPRVDNNANEKETHISAQDTPVKVDESDNNPSLFKEDDTQEETTTEGPVITFGDDLDVPAFIRNRQE